MPDVDKIIAFENGELDPEEVFNLLREGVERGWIGSLQGSYQRAAQALGLT